MSYVQITTWLWFAFIVIWLVTLVRAKKDINAKHAWLTGFAGRAIIFAAMAVIFQILAAHGVFHLTRSEIWRPLTANPGLNLLGTVLCAAGIGFAVWARFHLGRNWSAIPAIKENHELITSGPYRIVRHPIYTGITIALLGTALSVGWFWLVIFPIMAINFLWRIPIEERYMMQLFPNQYPAYKKRTKALIPFVW